MFKEAKKVIDAVLDFATPCYFIGIGVGIAALATRDLLRNFK